GQLYEAPKIEGSLLRQLTLPTRCCPHGSTREFLTETCDIMKNLVGLDEKSASLAARIVLCSAIVDALSIAPALVIAGPDTARANRLMTLLRCLCWRSVFLTSVTPASFCSLANGVRFTFLISQTNVSDKLRKLLDDSSNRDRKIPYRGRLLDLFGVQVIHSDSLFIADSWPLRSIQISVTPTNTALPDFGQDAQQRIATQFQQKLLSFRRANLGAARRLNFDESNFSPTLRDLARSLAAATPDDAELQAEVIELLREEDSESRSARWTDLHVIAVEAVLTAYKESPGEAVYVGELANIAETLLNGRGKNSEVDPGPFGKLLKMLHFVTEPRDAKGVKLLLTEAVRTHALQLARHLEIPGCEAPSLARPETTPQECCEKSNSILAM
ncbi:MAG TPA: hypothetical protein VKB40_08540, partial [Candidatus Acidoferrales bacterium]|nr:hypothetical protein [Candidatus Acidoferrales bacterium]